MYRIPMFFVFVAVSFLCSIPRPTLAQRPLPDKLLAIKDAVSFGCEVAAPSPHSESDLWNTVICPLGNDGLGETILFKREQGGWTAQQRLSAPERLGLFVCGGSHALSHEYLFLGCWLGPEEKPGEDEHVGGVLVYTWSEETTRWLEHAVLRPHQTPQGNAYGHCSISLAVFEAPWSGSPILIVGCPGLTVNSQRRHGAALAFGLLQDTVWEQFDLVLTPSDATAGSGCAAQIEVQGAFVLLRCDPWSDHTEHQVVQYLFRLYPVGDQLKAREEGRVLKNRDVTE